MTSRESSPAVDLTLMARVGIRQRREDDCGPAALASVLRYWGYSMSVGRLHDLCGRGARGSTLEGLYHAGRAVGARLVAVEINFPELAFVELPCLVPLSGSRGLSHFVVVCQFTAESVTVWNPSVGIQTMHAVAFQAAWPTQYAICRQPDIAKVDRDHPSVVSGDHG